MKNKIFLITAFFFTSITIFSLNALADEVVPIPKKRPAVMSASPAYIQELMNRGEIQPVDEQSSYMADNNIKDEIIHGDVQQSLAPQVALQNVPIPKFKPIKNAFSKDVSDLQDIEPAAESGVEPHKEDTLVSFALQPGQLDLDQNLKYFLNSRAVTLFKENHALNMEVRAYSTASDANEFSDVRLSLARALEVRKFLIEKNINPARIRLTPVGKTEQTRSSDRIDLIFKEE